MKCRYLFSVKNKKNTSLCHLLKILYRVLRLKTFNCPNKKGNRKVQGVPESQAAALPRHQVVDYNPLENTKLSQLKLFYQKKKKIKKIKKNTVFVDKYYFMKTWFDIVQQVFMTWSNWNWSKEYTPFGPTDNLGPVQGPMVQVIWSKECTYPSFVQ